jgi:hypothetical protein
MPVMVSTIPPIRSLRADRSSIAPATCAEESATPQIAPVACSSARTPSRATARACSAAPAVS